MSQGLILEVEIANYKLIKEFKQKFEAGHLYYISGKNKIGKTSLIKGLLGNLTATNKCDIPLTEGEKEGTFTTNIYNFKGADQQNYKIQFAFDGKKESFTLINPQAEVSHKVTDIRQVFGYNPYTIDEFFAWGTTAEGRRKQAKIVFDMLPDKVKEEINSIDVKVNEKNGILFKERAEAKKQVDAYRILVKKHVAIDTELIAKEQQIINLIEKLDKEYEAEKLIIKDREYMESIIEDITPKELDKISDIEINKEVSELIKDTREKLISIRERLKITMVNGLTLAQRIENGKLMKTNCINEKTKKQIQDTELKEVQTWNEKYLKLDKEINTLRSRKSELLSNSTIGIPGITITNDEFFLNVDGKDLPFSEESLSYSVAGLIIARLILETNKDLPIVCVGKAAEYDDESQAKLNALAKEYGGILLCDYVVPSQEEMKIIVYESVNN